jgi:hypothetical protein
MALTEKACHGNTRKDMELFMESSYFSVFFRVLPWPNTGLY